MLGSELGEPAPAVGPDRAAGRVLEGRDRVEERDRAASRDLGLERVGVESFAVHREPHDLGTLTGEDLQRPVVRRAFDEHPARLAGKLHRRVEDEPLQPARRQEHAPGGNAVLLGEQLPQWPVASADPVGEDRRAVARECSLGAIRDQRGVEALGRRCATRERDHAREPSGAGAKQAREPPRGPESAIPPP